MKGLNSVRLIGNLGSDPVMRITPTGKPITLFSMATSRKYSNQEGLIAEEITWHNIVCWDKLAENVKRSLKKGSAVYLEGRISNKKFESKDGQGLYRTEIIASDIIFLDNSPSPANSAPSHLAGEAIAVGVSLLNGKGTLS